MAFKPVPLTLSRLRETFSFGSVIYFEFCVDTHASICLYYYYCTNVCSISIKKKKNPSESFCPTPTPVTSQEERIGGEAADYLELSTNGSKDSGSQLGNFLPWLFQNMHPLCLLVCRQGDRSTVDIFWMNKSDWTIPSETNSIHLTILPFTKWHRMLPVHCSVVVFHSFFFSHLQFWVDTLLPIFFQY